MKGKRMETNIAKLSLQLSLQEAGGLCWSHFLAYRGLSLKHRRSSISQGELTNNAMGSLMSWGCSIRTSELLERNVGHIPGQSSWSDRVSLSLESQKYCCSLMIGRCKDILIALDMNLEWLRHSVQSLCTVL